MKTIATAYGILMVILMIPIIALGFVCQILWRYFEAGTVMAEQFEEWVGDKINKG